MLHILGKKEVNKKVPVKREFIPPIPTTRTERAMKRQKIYDELLAQCTEKEVEKVRKESITFEDRVKES